MPWYRDDYGRLWDYDDPTEAERDRLVPATPEDIEAHNHRARVEQAGEGTTVQAGVEGFQRGIGAVADVIQGATGFGTAPGLEELPGGGLGGLQDAYSPEARLRTEAHPIAAGIGTGLAAAPASGLAAAAGAAVLPTAAPLVGGAIGAIAGEAAVQAAAQEYDDAWLEERPMELGNVAAYTLMFSGFDLMFRGAWKGGRRLLFGPEKPATTSLGARNLVSEAQLAARELSPDAAPVGGGGSVGAARASDLAEPFDEAISTMADKDAAVLARDAEDHLHLISQHASEEFTRINQGLTDNLGSKLKYEDFATNAQRWDAAQLERQAGWIDEMTQEGDTIAREIAAFAEGNKGAIDYGNLGRKAYRLIDGFNHRIAQETDPVRRNWLIDQQKRSLDALTLSIDASFGVDDVTRTELKGLIGPHREALRKGLEDTHYWGENAELQKALNGPWHRFLEHWPRVQKEVLEATGHVQFDQMGAGRITKESTVDRMLALLGKDPRSNQEFGRHLAGAFEGLQDLIEVRQARGIAGTEGLEAMASDVRHLMEEWNLATTIGVAKNRVAAMRRDPRKWATIAADVAQRLPVVGQPIGVLRNLGDALTDLHIRKDTPLASVWDRAYRRYAGNPALQDPSIARNYADWVTDALKQRSGMIAGAGLFGLAATQEQTEGSAGAAAGLALLLGTRGKAIARARLPKDARRALTGAVSDAARGGAGKKAAGGAMDLEGALSGFESVPPAKRAIPSGDALPRQLPGIPDSDVFTPHVGSLAQNGWFTERLSGPIGKTPGGFFRGADGVIRYIKADKDPVHSATEIGAARMYRSLGVNTPEVVPVELPGGERAVASEFLGPQWRELDAVEDWSQLPQSVRDSYARTVPIDIILGNWDVSRNAKNVMTDDVTTLIVDAGEAGPNAWSASWFKGNYAHTSGELQRTAAYGKGRGEPTWAAGPGGGKFVGKAPPHELLREYAQLPGALREIVQKSYDDAVARINAAGGPEAFFRAHMPHLSDAEVQRAGKEMADRIAWLPKTIPVLAGALHIAFSPNNAQAQDFEPEPPERQPPEHAYRDAMREISRGGSAQVTALAAEALRKSRGAPKGPIELFGGRRSLEEAVEASRERLAEVTADPAALAQELAGGVGELWKTHPGVYSALTAKAAQIAAYLQQHVPQPTAATLLDPRGGKLSFDRAWEYAARFVGATRPRAALREIVRGPAPPEMVDAVKANWPELWDGLRIEVLGRVQRRAAAGRHLPAEQLRRLDGLLGLDGQLDPSASVAVAGHLLAAQDAEAQRRQQMGQGMTSSSSTTTAAASYRTRLAAANHERQLQ